MMTLDLTTDARMLRDRDVLSIVRHKQYLTSLEMSYVCRHLSDRARPFLQQLVHLRHLGLSFQDAITDTRVGYFVRYLRKLESISLAKAPKLTDQCLVYLRHLPQLRYLNLTGCEGLTEVGVTIFRTLRPEVQVEWGTTCPYGL